MRSFTAVLSIATLAAGIVYTTAAMSAVPSKKESAAQALARKKKQLRSSKSTSARRGVNPADVATNRSSIDRKHAKRLDDVRKNSVKVSTSVATPGEAQYQAELREYEQKKRDYEKALAAYEVRKLEMRAAQSKAASAPKATKSKAMSTTAIVTTQAKPVAPAAPRVTPQIAPTSASTNVSTTAAMAPAAKGNPLILNYVGSFEGASLQSPGGEFAPNKDGTESDSPQTLYHLPTIGYRLTPDFSMSLTPTIAQELTGEKRDLTWLDPYLRLKLNNIYKDGPVTFNSDLRIYPGMSEGSKKAGRIGRVRNTQYLNIDLGKSFTLAWTSYIRLSAYQREGYETSKQGDDFKVMVNPALKYAFSDKLTGGIQWEGNTAHEYGEDPGFNTGSSGVLKLGVEWSPMASLWINPLIGLPTGQGTRLLDGRSAQVLLDFQITAF